MNCSILEAAIAIVIQWIGKAEKKPKKTPLSFFFHRKLNSYQKWNAKIFYFCIIFIFYYWFYFCGLLFVLFFIFKFIYLLCIYPTPSIGCKIRSVFLAEYCCLEFSFPFPSLVVILKLKCLVYPTTYLLLGFLKT